MAQSSSAVVESSTTRRSEAFTPFDMIDGVIYQQQRLDKPGIAYLSIAIIYLVGICAGIRFVVQHRHYASFRHRDVWMTLVSLIALTTIITFCLIQYPTNGTIPCSLDFWIFAIFLPFGFITTLVKMARLLFLYRSHERAATMIKSPSIDSTRQAAGSSIGSKKSPWNHFLANWTYAADIISGKEQKKPQELTAFFSKLCSYLLAFHVVMTFAVYMADPSIGERVTGCHKGWQWIPHSAMILAYIWICGPLILYASRDIHDSLNMKLEMQIMIYGYMITTPFCVLALATHAFDAISDQFPPFMWFAPILMIVSINMFLLPLIDRWHLHQAERAIKTETVLPGATINKELAHVLLRDDKAFEKFKEFTVRDLSVENPLFARQVIKWRNLCLPKETIRATSSLNMPDGAGLLGLDHASRMTNVSRNILTEMAEAEQQIARDAVEDSPSELAAPVAASASLNNASPIAMAATNANATAAAAATTTTTTPAAAAGGAGANQATKRKMKPELIQQAMEIYKGFIEDNSRMEINITNDAKRKIIHEMRLDNITPQLFDQALVEICMLMHTDTWPRYLRDAAKNKPKRDISRALTMPSKQTRDMFKSGGVGQK